eukprot:COSAG05_NODE_21421_length_272_cov_0.589595_1_plen_90_part_11
MAAMQHTLAHWHTSISDIFIYYGHGFTLQLQAPKAPKGAVAPPPAEDPTIGTMDAEGFLEMLLECAIVPLPDLAALGVPVDPKDRKKKDL